MIGEGPGTVSAGEAATSRPTAGGAAGGGAAGGGAGGSGDAPRKGGAHGVRPEPPSDPIRGYGNIYTPHAGSMIIQVQRESGLQSRTIVLSGRQVRVLRFITSRTGKILAACAAAIAVLLIVEAARVPTLTGQIARMQHTAQRLDTLERSLSELQKRYDQVRTMMGGDAPNDGGHGVPAAVGFAPAPTLPSRVPANARGSGSAGTDASMDLSPDVSRNVSRAPRDAATDAPANGSADANPTAGAAAASPASSGDQPADSTAGAVPTPRARRPRRTRAPEAIVPAVPPPPDSGAPPSPEAEPQ